MVGLYFLTLEGLQIIHLWDFLLLSVFLTHISLLDKPDLEFRTNTEKVNMLGGFSVFPTRGLRTRLSGFGYLLCT